MPTDPARPVAARSDGAERILVRRSGPLEGSVDVPGAKNSVLKLMAATLLADGRYELTNTPGIADVDTIRVDFPDKSSYVARRISVDRENDLALIKVDPLHPLKVMPCGVAFSVPSHEPIACLCFTVSVAFRRTSFSFTAIYN